MPTGRKELYDVPVHFFIQLFPLYILLFPSASRIPFNSVLASNRYRGQSHFLRPTSIPPRMQSPLHHNFTLLDNPLRLPLKTSFKLKHHQSVGERFLCKSFNVSGVSNRLDHSCKGIPNEERYTLQDW